MCLRPHKRKMLQPEDQKLPDQQENLSISGAQSHVVTSQQSNTENKLERSRSKKSKKSKKNENDPSAKPANNNNNNDPLICTNFIIDMYKNEKHNDYRKLEYNGSIKTSSSEESTSVDERQSVSRSVPSPSKLSLNDVDSTKSLVQRDINGKCLMKANNVIVQEPSCDISKDHVKFLNLFTILCCWCFPITGIIAIIFARKTKKYYEMREMSKAKKSLVKSEWMLIITIFFGCTIIGLTFGLLGSSMFKNDGDELQSGVYHRKSLS